MAFITIHEYGTDTEVTINTNQIKEFREEWTYPGLIETPVTIIEMADEDETTHWANGHIGYKLRN